MNNIQICAELLSNCQMSDCQDDYKFKVPNYHLRMITHQNNKLRKLAIMLRQNTEKVGG